jgi:predicted dehydrogenase
MHLFPFRETIMSRRMQRRDFLKTAAVMGAGVWLGTGPSARSEAANDKLNVAVVGIGGQGKSNLNAVSSQNIVALCDVDDQRAGDGYQRFPQARKFHDFRKMLDEMGGQIDAVVISTPDHTHFHPAYLAMQLGKHVYLEKPMAHSLWEVRSLTRLAAEKKVATQLGVQRHANPAVRRAAELIQSGAIGAVRECHAWVGGSRGMPEVPTDTPPVPAHLQWDLWLGPAAERPYNPAYAPYKWRFWWDFGTGETGNWGCHILDIPFWALGLKYPTKVEASGPEPHPQTTPKSMTTRFEFPAEGKRGPVTLHWYHGTPPILQKLGLKGAGANNLFIGSEGMLLCGFGSYQLLPEEKFKGFKGPDPFLPKSPGFHKEWLAACKGGTAASCHFDYSGPMTETVLLGNVAYRAGGFRWDAANLKAVDNPKAGPYLRTPFRKGWEV